MEAEIVLNLLDSYWYDLDLFQKSKPTKINQIPEKPTSYNSENMIQNLPTIHTNSPKLERMSSNHSKVSDSSYSSASPNSVLQSPRLQTIFSGKEIRDFDNDSKSEEKSAQEVQETSATHQLMNNSSNSSSSPSSYSADTGGGGLKGNMVSSRRRKKRLSKSLSDLEFEEIKGFMDLGFVFSEEDKDSTLASILPGLQRLGNNNTNDNNNNSNNHDTNNNNISSNNNNVINVIVVDKNASKSTTGVSRPYLSEAWELLEKKKKKESSSSLLKWKVPASSDQIDMKGYLKSWAHTVASAVK